MTITPSSLLSAFGTSIFSTLAAKKQELIRNGIDMIDLSIGSPDLAPPMRIRQILADHTLDAKAYGYTLQGTAHLHKAIASFYHDLYDVTLDSENEIVMTMGSQDGLLHFPMTVAEKGDIILVPDPGYTAYEAGVKISGAELYPMPLLEENDFLPDLKAIPKDVAQKARLMILNFPGNPVPALATKAFFQDVISFAKEHNIYVLHDFAYSELVFDGKRPLSFLAVEGAKDVGVEFNSLSKSFNLAGARIAYAAGNEELLAFLATLKSNLDYGVFLPIQQAAIYALEHERAFLKENRNLYMKRRDTLVNGLNKIGWHVKKPDATMFIWAKTPDGWTSETFTFALLEEANVVVTPGNAFGTHGEGYVRIALVQSEERLKEAVNRIEKSRLLEKNGSV